MASQTQIDFLSRKIDGVAARADALLERQVRYREEAQARADAEMEVARRQKARAYAEGCRQLQARYDDSYAAFGVQVPRPVDGEHPEKYRIRLFNRLVRKLPEGHAWSDTRADDLPLGPAMDNIEVMVLEAAKREGLAPSMENLPEDGTIIACPRSDDAGAKITEFFGRESFIKSMGRPGRKVAAIIDRRTGQAIWGRPFERA